MKLSDRLQMIADHIHTGETMADIGTDHGFLPIFLKQEGICPRVILTDISKGSLEKALGDCTQYASEETFDLRWGDGLSVLSPGEVDVVVIAGMGGLLISEILTADPALAASIPRYILQPRSQVGPLRASLIQNGFLIEEELLVRERDRICEILIARPGGTPQAVSYEDAPECFDYPDSLLEQRGELTHEYLTRALAKQQRNLAGLAKARKQSPADVARVQAAIDRLQVMTEEVSL